MIGIRDGNWRIANFSSKTPTGWCVIQHICLRITQPVVNSEVNDKISSQASQVQVRISKYIVPDIVWSWECYVGQLVPPYLPWLVLVSQGCAGITWLLPET